MRCDVRCGFTLVELMVAIAIVGVLLALLVPGMSGVWAAADDYRCTTNLYFLSQAIAMRRGDVAMGSRPELRPLRWPTLLLPYLEDQGGTFMCPVPSVFEEPSAVPDETDGGTGQPGWGTGPDDGASNPSDSYNAYPPLTELAELKIGSRFTPLSASPYTLKLSDEQFQAAFAQGWFGIDNSLRYPQQYFDCTYRPGANPNLYYLCTEDSFSSVDTGGSNQDFNDVVIRVLDKRNGTYELTASTATAGSHSIVSKPDGLPLLSLSTGGYGGRPPGGGQISVGLAEEDSSPAAGKPDTANFYAPDTLYSAGGAILSSNYAMNADTKYVTYRPGKVMLLDYYKYISHYTDDWTARALDPNQDGTPNFARHRGRINVLLTDGSVQFMDPVELDPLSPQAYAQYWAP
jgi:prepilin-type N-terminal cleavage/methylation domain-containing protein/prepilin-type processing-associated H-X9-DG protein